MRSQVDYLDWIGRLDSVVSEVFETMLARSCAPTDKADNMAQPIEAKIHFSGAIDGEFLLFVDRPLAQVTAELLLGPIPDPNDPMVDDAAKELCNMIAGGWKSKLAAKEAACAISPPTISSPQKVEFDFVSSEGFHRFYNVEGNVFGVQMVL